jgi:hypothetical protein
VTQVVANSKSSTTKKEYTKISLEKSQEQVTEKKNEYNDEQMDLK